MATITIDASLNSSTRLRRFMIASAVAIVVAAATALGVQSNWLDVYDRIILASAEAVLVIVSASWYYAPVHSGALRYLSPHPLFLFNLLVYTVFGTNFPIMMGQLADSYPFRVPLDNFIGPTLASVAGACAFDLCYRLAARTAQRRGAPAGSLDSACEYPLVPAVIVGTASLCGLLYLGSQYTMAGIVSRVVSSSAFDNSLLVSVDLIMFLALACSASIAIRARGKFTRSYGIICSLLTGAFLLQEGSRRLIVVAALTVCVCMAGYRRRRKTGKLAKAALVAVTAVAAALMVTAVRGTIDSDSDAYNRANQVQPVWEHLLQMTQSDNVWTADSMRTEYDLKINRLAAVEYTALIKAARDSSGAPYMFGSLAANQIVKYVPSVIYVDKGGTEPDRQVAAHFNLPILDELTNPISALYADGGTPAVIAGLALMGACMAFIFRWLLWRQYGTLLYASTLPCVAIFDQTPPDFVIGWIRALLLVSVVLYGSILLFKTAHYRGGRAA